MKRAPSFTNQRFICNHCVGMKSHELLREVFQTHNPKQIADGMAALAAERARKEVHE